VVLAHGGGEHSGRYAHVADALNERGYSVWALDHRGHGRSEGHRGLVDSIENAVEDLDTFIAIAREELGRTPFLLGHSMGGLISTAYAIRHGDRIAGLVLSGPVAAIEVSPWTRQLTYVLAPVMPTRGAFRVDPAEISRNPEVVRVYEQDPLVLHGRFPMRTAAELIRETRSFPQRAEAITVPVLIMHGDADSIATPRGSRMLHERISSPDKTLTIYEGLHHEILNEPERDRVIAEICDWLDARVDLR
jgi:acylglycerol lipase